MLHCLDCTTYKIALGPKLRTKGQPPVVDTVRSSQGCMLYICRLQVVSTKVGRIPEVLPPHLIHLAEPSVKGMILKTCTPLSLGFQSEKILLTNLVIFCSATPSFDRIIGYGY